MFIARHNARTALLRSSRRVFPFQARAGIKTVSQDMLRTSSETAERLEATGVWTWTRGRRPASAPIGDKHRTNITSQELCDDIVNYIGPSLERHRGCDLVDINPGVGLWSRALHEAVQPRKHILMENDHVLYEPFLADLIAKDNVKLVPKSGVVWKDLSEMLETCLPHQHKVDPMAELERNDTLLVSVNLSFYPPKRFQLFECVSTMVLYQLMTSIRTCSLFQQYGLVRMLVWVNDNGKRRLLPRGVTRRRRAAFEAELACEWIHEVAGKDVEVEERHELRDEWINMESGYRTLNRMRNAGVAMPIGRETITYNALQDRSLEYEKLAGVRRPILNRPFRQELEDLESAHAEIEDPATMARLKILRFRKKYDIEDSNLYLELLQQRDAILQLYSTSPADFAAADVAWNEKVNKLQKNEAKEFITIHNNYHLFRQEPPILHWDRRAYEPLAVRDSDFYPQVPCALLDLQPKAMDPCLSQYGPNSYYGEISEIMLRFWFMNGRLPVSKAMDCLWPGFGQLFDQVPSLRDVSKGGVPLTGKGEIVARCVNETQWAEMTKVFVDSPFAPTYAQVVGRLMEDFESEVDIDDDPTRGSDAAADASS
ncbi:hypothetical protein FZEAL_2429 [Fusarium zealandicum]|uniref:rRNA adenine N(6)-methyltransferase n=1 Tax=Fusarium zealandicum TaxID=1053134 RepID=A0A8H4UR35_9HYPO|nr:hypothetical protein FZEAL_2429 [Fusarium zealandicum]